MIRYGVVCGLALLAACAAPPEPPPAWPAPEAPGFRAPALPLFVQTPYLHLWSPGDRLTDDSPRLWNGQVKGMAGIIRIDGQPLRFLGLPGSPIPTMRQSAARVFPTRTEFEFAHEDVKLRLEFLTPTDPRDLQLLSLPAGFLRAEVSASRPRAIQIHLDVTAEWAVGSTDRRVTWDGLFRIRPSQPRLFRETANYADWGEVHWLAIDPAASRYGPADALRASFLDGRPLLRDARYPRAANDEWPAFAHEWDLGKVEKPVVRRALIVHARREPATFLGSACPAYWTRFFADGTAMAAWAAAQADPLRRRALALDAEVLGRARASGGPALAALSALLFRPSFAASELVLHRGEPFYLNKGFDPSGASPMQALDLLLPGAPALLAFNPSLLRLQLRPVLEGIRAGGWHERFAPRDLGVYPNATGPSWAADLRVDATASLLLLAGAAARHDPEFWARERPLLLPFAQYLAESGLSPDAQHAAEDLAAPLDKNAHLALKSIVALSLFPEHREETERRIKRWLEQAGAGPQSSLQLGDASQWSLKPAVFFDRLLGPVLPDALAARETAGARARADKYGAPLDSRRPVGRADALLLLSAAGSRAEREAIAAEVLRFYSETPARAAPADRYETDTGRPAGVPGRSVLGAVFAPLLLEPR
jgi:hypothetical protein